MRLIDSSSILAEIFSRPRPVYLRTEPESPDFTNHAPCKVIVSGGPHRVELDMDRDNVDTICGILGFYVFKKEYSSALLTWNLKSLLSYFRHYIQNPVEITSPVTDIHVIENFLGVKKAVPKTLTEAVDRAKSIGSYKSWKTVYKSVHIPLMMEILPSMETFPILDIESRCAKYAHYEIEGQRNGRLLCSKRFEKGYLPHTLGAAQKAIIRPRGDNLKFLSADIRHCEVSVLQWLSKDSNLKTIIDSGVDLYREIYRIITRNDCDTDKKREIAKRIFLPVMYGAGAHTLGEALQQTNAVARELIRRLHDNFPICSQWLQQQQEHAAEIGELTDFFGRTRLFPDKPYTARNFVVQGVAATVCLEKLIDLHRRLTKTPARLCFSIHDGYGIVLPSDRCSEVASLVHEVLESPSQLCPGLSLKAEVKVGDTLDNLTAV